jgi:hypothetical protein
MSILGDCLLQCRPEWERLALGRSYPLTPSSHFALPLGRCRASVASSNFSLPAVRPFHARLPQGRALHFLG